MQANHGRIVCPSLAEFRGYYNIPEADDIAFPVLRSIDRLPELTFPELWKICKAAEKWFAKAFPLLSDESLDPIAEDEFIPRCEADDRTLCIDHVDFPRLNSDVLRRLQREFLGRYPLWRVLLCADAHSACIVIYPTVIRFGCEPVDVDPDEALRRLVPQAMALRKERQRARRAEVTFLQRRLPEAVRSIGEQPALVFGVLENQVADDVRLTLYILVQGADDHVVDVEGPPEAGIDFVWTGNGYGVNGQGTIISKLEIPKSVPFCVKGQSIPSDYRGPLTITERATGKRHIYEVKSENISRPGDAS